MFLEARDIKMRFDGLPRFCKLYMSRVIHLSFDLVRGLERMDGGHNPQDESFM